MVIRRGFMNRERMKRSEKQGRGGKVLPVKHGAFREARRDKKASFSEQCIRLEEEVTEGERL